MKMGAFLIRVLCGFSVTLSALLHGASTQESENVCIDLDTNKKYAVGESWTVKGECTKYKCDETAIEDVPGLTIPASTKYICTEPVPADNDLRNCYKKVPYPDADYPKCCPHLICNRPGRVEIIRPKYN